MADLLKENSQNNVGSEIDNQKKHKVRTMSGLDLTLMGIGSIIGAGVLVLTGAVAATEAGPSVVFSFLIAAVVCGFSGLCYAEVSSTLPMSGSVYSYTNKLIGRFLANIIGFILIVTYILTSATVANGWSGYFVGLLQDFNITFPALLSKTPSDGGIIDIPATFAVLFITYILSLGTKDNRKINNLMVIIKLFIIVLFIVFGFSYVKPSNWTPFFPFGVHGVFIGAASVFFSFLGFDAISTAAEDVINPQKNMPRGIICALLGSTAIYVVVCFILTGILPYPELNVSDALSFSIYKIGETTVASIIATGAIIGILTVIFAFLYATSRVVTTMSRDGLLPEFLSKTDSKTQAPKTAIWIFGIICAIITGLINIKDLAHLSNVGSLVAFITVAVCLMFLRKKHPELTNDGFKVPFYPVLPILAILACIFLLFNLPIFTWVYLIIWIGVALVNYFYRTKIINI